MPTNGQHWRTCRGAGCSWCSGAGRCSASLVQHVHCLWQRRLVHGWNVPRGHQLRLGGAGGQPLQRLGCGRRERGAGLRAAQATSGAHSRAQLGLVQGGWCLAGEHRGVLGPRCGAPHVPLAARSSPVPSDSRPSHHARHARCVSAALPSGSAVSSTARAHSASEAGSGEAFAACSAAATAAAPAPSSAAAAGVAAMGPLAPQTVRTSLSAARQACKPGQLAGSCWAGGAAPWAAAAVGSCSATAAVPAQRICLWYAKFDESTRARAILKSGNAGGVAGSVLGGRIVAGDTQKGCSVG